jgi:hypothetical protein
VSEDVAPPFDWKAEVLKLVEEGKAEDLLWTYSEHKQSCSYVWGIVKQVAEEPDDKPMVTAQQFARNLLDDWGK